MKTMRFRMIALMIALMLIWTSVPATAAELFSPMAMKRITAKEFLKDKKPIDLTGEIRHVNRTVTSLKLSNTAIKLKVGQEYRMKLIIKGTGEKPDLSTAIVSSTNEFITTATYAISEDQTVLYYMITGTGPGTATLTVTLEGKKATAKVTVAETYIGSVELSQRNLSLIVGETQALTAQIYPFTTAHKVKWKISNPRVATITADGQVTGKKKGTATITATYGKYSAKCSVSVASTPTAAKYFDYQLNNAGNAVALKKYKGKDAHVIVPEKLGGYPVEVILDSAFANNSTLKSVVLPDGLKIIDKFSFSECPNLQTVIIPDSVSGIATGAFNVCGKLKDVQIPKGCTTLQTGVFFRCTSITDLALPATATIIPTQAFYRCSSLRSVSIPPTLTNIGDSAFGSCYQLREIALPDTLRYIGDAAFRNCIYLKTVKIPGSVPTIPANAFLGCLSLQEVEIGEGTTAIEDAFVLCMSMQRVRIPPSVTSIHEFAFLFCSSSMVIEGKAGSYAQSFAAEHNIRFVEI